MKKIISLVALFVVTAAFIGCGPDTKATPSKSPTAATPSK